MSNFKTVQLKTEDLERVAKLSEKLSKELGIKMSLAKTIMYAVNKLEAE